MVKKDAENGEKILQFLDRKSFSGGLNSKKTSKVYKRNGDLT
jgi:hypothetical protein